MKKSLGAKRFLYPMPALMVGSYDENGNPDVCNVGWGGICSSEPPWQAYSEPVTLPAGVA